MAYGGTPSYSDWMRQNPAAVQQVQQRYAQPAQAAAPATQQPPAQQPPAAPVAPTQPATAQPVQAQQSSGMSSMMQQMPQLMNSDPLSKQQGDNNLTAGKIAGIIASFYTGGAAAGAMGAANAAK